MVYTMAQWAWNKRYIILSDLILTINFPVYNMFLDCFLNK